MQGSVDSLPDRLPPLRADAQDASPSSPTVAPAGARRFAVPMRRVDSFSAEDAKVASGLVGDISAYHQRSTDGAPYLLHYLQAQKHDLAGVHIPFPNRAVPKNPNTSSPRLRGLILEQAKAIEELDEEYSHHVKEFARFRQPTHFKVDDGSAAPLSKVDMDQNSLFQALKLRSAGAFPLAEDIAAAILSPTVSDSMQPKTPFVRLGVKEEAQYTKGSQMSFHPALEDADSFPSRHPYLDSHKPFSPSAKAAKKLSSVCALQRGVRHIIAARRVDKLRKEQAAAAALRRRRDAALTIQCCFRRFVAVRKLERMHVALAAAALTGDNPHGSCAPITIVT